MHLITYKRDSSRLGALVDGWVVDLARAHAAICRALDAPPFADVRIPDDMIALLQGGPSTLQAARVAVNYVSEQMPYALLDLRANGIVITLGDVELQQPVLRPNKVICVGVNYYSLAEGAGERIPDYPILFHKTSTPLIGSGQPIELPRLSNAVAPEGELAVVIGKRGKHIAEQNALAHVAGYTCVNDVTAKDIEFRTPQWSSGKMIDTFGPLGPALVTADEISCPDALDVRTWLNGQVIQQGNTSGMIFSVAQLISYISSLTTLDVGDVILTGTPSDLGLRDDPVLLRPGDTVEVEIEGIGRLSNPVVLEPIHQSLTLEMS